jgi:UDP-glucose 4-epimerase
MNCLVTGGAGFIGSNLVKKLLDLGHNVIVLDNESSKYINTPVWDERAFNCKLDITNYENTKMIYKDVDYVFHLAAEVRIQESIENPIRTFEKNVLGTISVLQASKEAGVKRVVLSSTSAVYGKNQLPNIEDQTEDPLNPYSVSKLSAEKICKMYSDLYGIETISLRYFNVYGDGQPEKGDYAPVIGIFKRQKDNDESLTIVGDGSQSRDFVHVSDVVEANILAAFKDIDKKYIGQSFNVGSKKDFTVKEIADTISDNQIFIESRQGEMNKTLASIDKISTIFGWTPKYNLIDWLKNNV